MRTGINKSVIFVLTSTLVITLLYGSSTTLNVFAVPPASGWNTSNTCGAETKNPETGDIRQTCCWKERTGTSLGPGKEVMYCQTCDSTAAGVNCKPRVQQALQPLTPPSFDPTAPLQGGVLEQQQTPPPFAPGFLERQQLQAPADQGAAELPPATVEEEPVPPCPKGQVLDEETGLCVLEEPEAAEGPAQSEPEDESSGQEEQPPAEEDENNN